MFVLAFRPRFEKLEDVVGGDQIRPYEIFTNLAKQGHTVHVLEFSSNRKEDEVLYDGKLRISSIGNSPLPLLRMRRAIVEKSKWARQAGFEELIFYQQVPVGVYMWKGFLPLVSQPGIFLINFVKRFGFKVWSMVHDLSPDHELAQLERLGLPADKISLGVRLQAWMQARYLPKVDFICGVSKPFVRVLEERYKLKGSYVFLCGCNEELVRPIPEWTPPDSEWCIGYLGSPNDVSLELLVESVVKLNRSNVKLLLAGRNISRVAEEFRSRWPNIETVDGAKYKDFASIATRVDIWASVVNDSYALKYAWQLKIPMTLGSGRPLVMTKGEAVSTSGLEEYIYHTGGSSEEAAAMLAAVMDNPAAAQSKARSAREKVLESYSWAEITRDFIRNRLT